MSRDRRKPTELAREASVTGEISQGSVDLRARSRRLLSLQEYERLIAERWVAARKGRPTGIGCSACGGELIRQIDSPVQSTPQGPRVLVQCSNRECNACAVLPLPPGAV
jgi:hypothetical protein